MGKEAPTGYVYIHILVGPRICMKDIAMLTYDVTESMAPPQREWGYTVPFVPSLVDQKEKCLSFLNKKINPSHMMI